MCFLFGFFFAFKIELFFGWQFYIRKWFKFSFCWLNFFCLKNSANKKFFYILVVDDVIQNATDKIKSGAADLINLKKGN